MNGERPNTSENTDTSPWDSLTDTSHDMPTSFEGERNINDKTGKKRSFVEFDLYPRMKGETSKEYGERLRFMHQKTAEYLAKQKELEEPNHEPEVDKSSENSKEVEESYYDHMMKKLDLATKEGRITEGHKENLEDLLNRRFKDKALHEETEDDKAYQAWLSRHEAENQENLKRGPKRVIYENGKKVTLEENKEPENLKEHEKDSKEIELEKEKAKLLELERQKQLEFERAKKEEIERIKNLTTAEKQAELAAAEAEKAKNTARIEEINKKIEPIDAQEELEKNKARIAEINKILGEDASKPLVAINADFTKDKKDLAHDLAEQELNSENSKSGFLKRLWKGTLFKKYYEQKYTREFTEGERKAKIGDEELSVDEILAKRKNSAISRFIMSVTEDSEGFIHQSAGESMEEADEETTTKVRTIIEKFASAQNLSAEDRKREFDEDMKRLRAESVDDGRPISQALLDNYELVATQAFNRVSHGIAIEDVMDGFKVYNAKVRDGVRTEAHRDAIDKVVNWLESSKIGQFIPAEVIAGAVSVTSALTQTGVRAVAGAAGGMLVSSAISGLKERNRITEDRARMLRDAANGLSYEGQSGTPETKRAKYEARIGGTLYELRSANDLASNIQNSLQQEASESRDENILRAIAEARVRIDFSDSESKDLISYTSADKRGEERLKLDIATIRAEKALSESGIKRLETMKEQIRKEIEDSTNESDRNFSHMRAAMAAKKAGKTLLIGASTFFVSQEVVAALDPGKVGLLEKLNIIKTENNTNASETILAGLVTNPGARASNIHTETIENISADREVEIRAYEEAGYKKIETAKAWTETKTTLGEVKPEDSTAAIKIKHDGWANNGTKGADGNELRTRIINGSMVSRMRGNSTMNGRVFNYDALAAEGKIKGYLTIGGAKFELVSKVNDAGQLTWGENGIFTTTTGETIRGIGENGEKLYRHFEIALDNGVDADGIHHIIPFATDSGRNTFTGTMSQATETVIEHPAVYSFIKTTVNEVPISSEAETIAETTTAGFAFAPETARTGLGEVNEQEAQAA